MKRMRIEAGPVIAWALLDDSATAEAVWAALPLSAPAGRFGGEVYVDVPLRLPLAPDARDIMEPGELGYWPDGPGIALFFDRTTWSRADEIRAYSAVNVFGRLEGDPRLLEAVADGVELLLSRPG